MSNGPEETPLEVLALVSGCRHRVQQYFEDGKSHLGTGDYECRSWAGWHHHVTLSLLALWFLQAERLRLGGKNAGGDRAPGAGDLHGAAPGAQPQPGPGRGGGERGAAA